MTTQQIDRDQLIMSWQAAQRELEAAKEKEMELRKNVAHLLFPNAKSEGTTNIDLGAGYKLKLTNKVNYRMAGNDDVDAALEEISKIGNEGSFIAERLVTWSPRLALSEYRDLPHDMRKIIDKVVTTSPGAPTLEVVEPKAKK